MAEAVKQVWVKLVCKTEDKVIANISAPEGVLDYRRIIQGAVVADKARMPDTKLILDGVQLTCARCHEPLFFKAQDEVLFAAMPGSVTLEA